MLIDEILFRAGPDKTTKITTKTDSNNSHETAEEVGTAKKHCLSDRFCVQVDLVATRYLNESVSVTIQS